MSLNELQPYQLLQKAADFFERIGVTYRIVGSMASIAYGETRFTNDIDILVDLSAKNLGDLTTEFPEPEFYLSADAAREAIRDRRQFSIIHVPSGLKLDIIQRKDNEFGTLDITSGQRLRSEGFYDAWFASPENIILMKLRYFKEGGSDKHLRDVSAILQIQGATVDRTYLGTWADRLGVSDDWKLVGQSTNSKPD